MGTPRLGLNREKGLLETYLSRDQILVEGSQDLERQSGRDPERAQAPSQAGRVEMPRRAEVSAKCSWWERRGLVLISRLAEGGRDLLSCSGHPKMSKRIP